jgi:hypothetical protein
LESIRKADEEFYRLCDNAKTTEEMQKAFDLRSLKYDIIEKNRKKIKL